MSTLWKQVWLIVQDGVLKCSTGAYGYVRSIFDLPSFPFDKMPTLLPSLRSIAKLALGSVQVAFVQNGELVKGGAPLSCPAGGQLSCQNTTAVADTCCFNAPGGLFLQTQFWDTAPSTGPSDHWTIHGLWYVLRYTYRERALPPE